MRDILIVLLVCVVAYGAWYAANPIGSLRRKYRNKAIPKTAVRTARISGIVMATLGAAGLLFLLTRGEPAG